MLKHFKNWFKNINVSDGKHRNVESLNPLGWGTLFFTSWISLKVVEELNPNMQINQFQKSVEWLLLGISIILLVAVYWPWLRNKLTGATEKYNLLPLVFIISVVGYILGWLPGFNLKGLYQGLAVSIGFLWLITPIMVVMARLNRPLYRGFFCLGFLVLWLFYFVNKGFIGSLPLLVIAALGWWPCIWPKRFRDISVI